MMSNFKSANVYIQHATDHLSLLYLNSLLSLAIGVPLSRI